MKTAACFAKFTSGGRVAPGALAAMHGEFETSLSWSLTSTKRRPMESTSYRAASKKQADAVGKTTDTMGRLIL